MQAAPPPSDILYERQRISSSVHSTTRYAGFGGDDLDPITDLKQDRGPLDANPPTTCDRCTQVFAHCLSRVIFEFLGTAFLSAVVALSSGEASVYAGVLFGCISLVSKPLILLNPALSLYMLMTGASHVVLESAAIFAQVLGAGTGCLLSLMIQKPLMLTVTMCSDLSFLGLEILAMFIFGFVLEITRMHMDQDTAGTFVTIGVALTSYTNFIFLQKHQVSLGNPAITLAAFISGWDYAASVMEYSLGILYSCVLGPLIGIGIGILVGRVVSLDGQERQAFLRFLSHFSPSLLELVGSFAISLVFFYTGHIPACGSLIAALSLAGWRKSGAHMNPSLSLSVSVTRGRPVVLALVYACFQVLGTFVAFVCVKFALPGGLEGLDAMSSSLSAAWLILEGVCVSTYVVIFLVGEAEMANDGFFMSHNDVAFLQRILAGVAVVVGAGAVLPRGGGLLNPAVCLTLAVVYHDTWADVGAQMLVLFAGTMMAAAICWAVETSRKILGRERAPTPGTGLASSLQGY